MAGQEVHSGKEEGIEWRTHGDRVGGRMQAKAVPLDEMLRERIVDSGIGDWGVATCDSEVVGDAHDQRERTDRYRGPPLLAKPAQGAPKAQENVLPRCH